MSRLPRWLRSSDHGVAAVAFALTFPILLYLFAGVTDFGLVFFRQSCLSTALAAGAQYAVLQDQASGAVTESNIQTVMQNAATQAMANVSVSAVAACYCITGTATTAWNTNNPISCSGTCSGGVSVQKYVYLTLTTNYQAIMPGFSKLAGTTTLRKTAWIPLQ